MRAIGLGGPLTYVHGLINAAPGDGRDRDRKRISDRDYKRRERARLKAELERVRSRSDHDRIVAAILAIPARPLEPDAG